MAVTNDLIKEGFIERYKDFFENPAPQQLQFARDMFHLIATNTDTSKLTVIPARCGIGKSLFIRALISYFCTFDTYDYREDKDWLIQEYHAFRDKMTSLLREKEKTSSNVDRFYWRDHYTSNITSNDERFFELLEKYKKPICKQYVNAITDFNIFKSIMIDGAFFTTTKNARLQDYETYFQIFKDNKNKFYLGENKVKCFVFDATADVDPDYHLDYVNKLIVAIITYISI